MTEKKLSQLFYLNKEIEKIREELFQLEEGFYIGNSKIDGMPKTKGNTDRVGKLATEIADLKELLNINYKKLYIQRNIIERYIQSIDDIQIRVILRLRHINFMDWRSIGDELNYCHTVVFKKYKNYLKKNKLL